jgi:hypothetical protein
MATGGPTEPTEHTSALRKLLCVCAAAVLSILVVVAVRYGLAGSVADNAAREIGRAGSGSQSFPSAWWFEDLRRAVAALPSDATAHELLGVAIEARSNDPIELAEARDEFERAIAQRPGSPYTWANLAEVKYRLGETDTAFENAIIVAAQLGPYEPEVQRDIVNYGLAVLDEVRPATRASIQRVLEIGMKRNPGEMLQIAARRGRLSAACRHLDGARRPAESKWTQLCQSMEATS